MVKYGKIQFSIPVSFIGIMRRRNLSYRPGAIFA